MTRTSLGAVSAAFLLTAGGFAGTASAADLGGDCCADLEERVAELEATTVRKGNRKVSLTITGWVAEQVMWWDDGVESNAYVTGVGTTLASHFKLVGEAQIRPGLSAGYLLHIEAAQADPLIALDQSTDDGGPGLNAHQSYWFLKSDQLGKVSVGLLSPASDNTAILVDGSGTLVPANWVLFDNRNFRLRSGGDFVDGARWADLATCTGGFGVGGDCGGFAGPGNYIRYDTPTFYGFSASADWGEDDAWDVALRWAGEYNGIKVAAAASYFEHTDDAQANPGNYVQVGGYIQHVPTGLFAYGAFGADNPDNLVLAPNFAVTEGDAWCVKAGIRRRWTPLGHTVLFGEYGLKDDMLSERLASLGATTSELTQWGAGVVQEIDAAAMSLWLVYRHFEGEVGCAGQDLRACDDATSLEFDDFDVVKFGALISF